MAVHGALIRQLRYHGERLVPQMFRHQPEKYVQQMCHIRGVFTGHKICVHGVSQDPVEGIAKLTVEKQEIDENKLPEDAVVVAVKSCAVHWVDVLMIAGQYQQAPPIPYTPGMEYSGIVAHPGTSKELKAGDSVYVGDIFNTGPRSYGDYAAWGGMASYSVAPASSVQKLPGNLSFDEAAGLNGAAETAYHGLVHCGNLKKGETVLIQGATGSSGLAAVQIASAVGANMILTGGSAEKLKIASDQARGEGQVKGVFNYNEEGANIVNFVKSLGIKGVDVIYDTVGGNKNAKDLLRLIKFGGRFLVIGWTSTPLAGGGRGAGADHATANSVPTNLIMMKGAQVIGCPVAIHTRLNPAIRKQRLQTIDEWVKQDLIKPYSSHNFAFNQFREALLAKWNRSITGNCILRCQD
eukprot:TRINITY_DN1449_c0_g1_i6.p1 TRINITY_DN1449_c0_g1~~TRINITY_DN1449_c0_g1_i6.p1  ORF type:complete len:409 (-),score=82.28 TRINITY_DN1449_c0_g1_i6:146-1372(-)